MTMLEAGVAILVIAFGAVGFLWVLPAWRGYRGKRVVRCPESEPAWEAAVEVDSARVAVSAWGGPPDVRLKDCSRWPEKANCEQECLSQVGG